MLLPVVRNYLLLQSAGCLGVSLGEFLSGYRRSSDDILLLIASSGCKCLYCSVELTIIYPSPASLTIDHIVPRCRGGSHDLSNLVPCCDACNHAKGCQCHLNFCVDLDGFACRYGQLWARINYFTSSMFVEDLSHFAAGVDARC